MFTESFRLRQQNYLVNFSLTDKWATSLATHRETWPTSEGVIGLKCLLSHWWISFCGPCLHHTGHRAGRPTSQLQLALAHCSLLWLPEAVLETMFIFRCQGLGLAGKIVFTTLALSAEETETDQNRWAELFSLSFALLWVNTCLQVNMDRIWIYTKMKLITRKRSHVFVAQMEKSCVQPCMCRKKCRFTGHLSFW